MPKRTSTFVEWVWLLVAATLMTLSVTLAVIRLALPELNSQRDNLALWISDAIGRPAEVGEIESSWNGWVPTIQVRDLAVYDVKKTTELIRFERATINVAPLRSLLAGALTPRNLIVSGVSLTLHRDENGQLSVAGMPPPKSPVVQWLIEQDNFAVTGADLTIVDAISAQTIALSDLSLTIRNREGARILSGIVDLPPDIGKQLVLELDISGNPLTSDWDGALNFRLAGVSSSYLSDQFDDIALAHAASVDIVGWSRWHEARLNTLRFKLSALDSESNPQFTADGLLNRHRAGWLLQLIDIELPQRARAAAGAKLSLAWSSAQGKTERAALRGVNLPVELFAVLGSALKSIDGDWQQHLTRAAPSGLIEYIDGAWNSSGGAHARYFADLRVAGLSVNQSPVNPGVAGLETEIVVRPNGVKLHFDNAQFKVNQDKFLLHTLDFSAVNGALSWRPKAGQQRFAAEQFNGEVNGTEFIVNGQLSQAEDLSRYADLRVALPQVDAPRLHHLVPLGVLPPRGERWTRDILQSGRVHSGLMVLRGPLAQFPFRHAEGVFAAKFNVIDSTLRYSPRWPQATDVQGLVRLDGPRSSMTVEHAIIEGAKVLGGTITMDDLFIRERFVHVSGNVTGPGSSAAAIVMASPLKTGRAARLNDLEIDGELNVKLDMEIALFPGGPRSVLGQANLDGNRIHAPLQRLTLDDFKGTISFTKSDWYGEGITATYKGNAVGLVINGGLNDPNYDSEFRMTGTSPAEVLLRELKASAPSIHRWLEHHQSLNSIRGELPWKAVLTIPVKQSGDDADQRKLPRRLTLESSLRGLQLDLPRPLQKSAQESAPLRLDFELLDRVAVRTRIDYGDIVDAEFNAKAVDGRPVVTRAEFLLGKTDPVFSEQPGVTFNGYLPQLDVNDWLALLRRGGGAPTADDSTMPMSYDLQISNLNLFGSTFNDLRISGKRSTTHWLADVSGEQATGAISIPLDLAGDDIQLEFEQLRVQPRSREKAPKARHQFDPRTIPGLHFSAREFAFGDVELGSAELQTRRIDDGLTLERLEFTDTDFALDASGDWLQLGEVQSSRFEINVNSGTLANVLKRFGYKGANVKNGKTVMRIDATWPGTPVDFSLANLTGHFELHVADGRILDVEPGSGRLFGLLSVQTLPRRLLLDFSDIFRKGFVFDAIDGVFVLEHGNAYTNSLLMDGPAAKVNISGRTGLAAQDYDQSVIVTPALSSSIPVAGALFGPIGVGAGAVYFLGQKMFKSIPEKIDQFLSRKYSVTGSWDDPAIERL